MTAALEAERLYRFFHAGDDEVLALRGVSISVAAGEMVAVTGPSGSGKSTLLACLAGLDEPDGGTVSIGGRRLSRQPETERTRLRRAGIGILFQTTNLIEHLDVLRNITLVQRLGGSPATPARGLLDDVGVASRSLARPSELSGGELARAGLAVALANDPTVLLCDEPTGELDSATEATIVALLRSQADRGRAVVVVTHSEPVARVADRTLQLEDGSLVA
jgi:putative ABC transport system ATP-binding protein